MPKIEYVPKRFNDKHEQIVVQAQSIIDRYQSQGFTLTLRQLYYQFVARNLLPNKDKSYDLLGRVISAARLAGRIDWESITDRTRSPQLPPTYSGPAELIKNSMDWYGVDLWEGQQWRPEVWIEKDALVGIINPICRKLGVAAFSCRGYASQSSMWEAGMRLAGAHREGQRPIILHLGDHDASGLDMTRDIAERLSMFAGTDVVVQRLALNMDQIEEYAPPPNPAKLSDARSAAYVQRYGFSSWELDSLEPRVLVNLIKTGLSDICDRELWKDRKRKMLEDEEVLKHLVENWDAVAEAFGSHDS